MKTVPLSTKQRLEFGKGNLLQVRLQSFGTGKSNQVEYDSAVRIQVQFYIKAFQLVKNGCHAHPFSIEQKDAFGVNNPSLFGGGKRTEFL